MRDTKQLARLFGEKTASTISTARILVVGAGGIGCELLKNLSMSGFGHIKAVDLDTIDLSNLNRQFLFQRVHIKKPKAQVATQAIQRFNPGLDASFEQANIKQPEFDVDWFSQFDLVLNALDNLDARRHVNSMCLAAHVPLVESGTAGYLGQVTVISGGTTECFECQPKPAERKTYPVCTIRSTPTAPIHCIVWAKDYLFAQIFGEKVPDELDAKGDEGEDLEELRQLREESWALAKLTAAMGSDEFAKLVFQKVFDSDVARLLSMRDMWKHRQPPRVLHFDQLHSAVDSVFDPASIDDHAPMSLEQSFALFKHSADKLAQRHELQKNSDADAFLAFDKDDDDTLRFVAAAANLRSYAFGIDPKSIFSIKAMAGNIIPAIATTNAIVAGMMVVQGALVLGGRMPECHTAYLSYSSKRPRSIVKDALAPPNARCAVCRRRYLTLRVAECSKTTLGDVVDCVGALAGTDRDLNLGDEISVVEGSRILYDYDYDDNLSRSLKDLGLVPGKMVTLSRDDDSDTVPVVLSFAKPRQDAVDGGDLLVIEGFELIPEFAPLPATAMDQSGGGKVQDEGSASGNPGAATGATEVIEEAGLSVGDDGAILLEDDDDDDDDNDNDNDNDNGAASTAGVQRISDELAKRNIDEVSASGPPGAKRRATGDSEVGESVELAD
ncbi:E1 ubiquitin-activating protein uba2 [Coemansia sp. RSA 1813]|nr:E1 ubiquitin-activating protein uba2 [Coemansia sp. RSA 1843]KAJ2212110.1 E1 ubiquitin-activating protein uba2 [Coemansia sp. RSA 487]KAJ2571158.1 E1 ubiquitin-activating protein uba2 [Coemansia sp. RSA 1813]